MNQGAIKSIAALNAKPGRDMPQNQGVAKVLKERL
jgi:hypothetical protein